MAQPVVQKIGQASKAAWPKVSAAMAETHRTMEELAGIAGQVVPGVEEYVARGDGAPIRRRKICEETIWVLASLGWLRTGPEHDVILAAKALFDADPLTASEKELIRLEENLELALKSLPEYTTQEVPS